MVEKTEKKEVTETITHDQVKHLGYFCDWCGEEVPSPGWMRFRELDIKFHKGWGGSHACGESWEVEDLCDKCVGKLRKLLGDNGVTVKDSDW